MTYQEAVALTQEIARKKGIFWEEEQAEIVHEITSTPEYLERITNSTSVPQRQDA